VTVFVGNPMRYMMTAKALLLMTVFGLAFAARSQSAASSPTQRIQNEQNVAGVVIPGSVETEITEWDLPTPNSEPQGIFFNKRDGFTWYSAEGANLLGRFDPKTKKFDEYHLRPGSDPYALVEHSGSGVQTTVYFTSHTGGFIGEYDAKTREVREFRIAGGKLLLNELSFDPNGVVWFTVAKAKPPKYPQGSKIGSLNLFSSEIKLAETPTRNASPYSLAVDSKGTPFFTEIDSSRLASIHPVTMKVTEYALPNRDSGARSLTITPDDAIWYTDFSRGYLGRFDAKTGKFKEWPSPSGPKSRPSGITNVGNTIWYAEAGTAPNMIVRFDPQTERFQSWQVPAGGAIERIYAQPDGTLWFTRPSTNRIARVTTKEK
jgi:virginiamycin B lyase